jgi:hypothetical protein
MVIEVHNSDKDNIDECSSPALDTSVSKDKACSNHHSSSKSNSYKNSGEITNDSNIKSSSSDGASSSSAAASTTNQIASSYDLPIPDDCVISCRGSELNSNAISSSASSINTHSQTKSSNASDDKSSAAITAVAINIDEHATKAIEFWKSENPGVEVNSTLKEIAIEAYKIHYIEKRGITRVDLVNRLKYSEKYAKKLLYECQSNKLLVPLEGRKQGRFNEYFLTTEIDKFLERQKQQKRNGSKQPVDYKELSVIQIIINEITQRKPTIHKIFIHFKTLPLEKDVTFDDAIYQSLLAKDNWIVKSKENKAKVKSFNLESKRSCTIQVYPLGKIVVMIQCSYRPFKLHDVEGSQEFWKSIGKIEFLLGQEFRQTVILPPSGQWLLKGYDRDVTIPESELVKKYPYFTHWYSKEGIQLRALGRVFQIYGKIMPICGKCLRFEEKVGIKEDVPLEQGIKEAAERPLEIVTAFEMLNSKRKEDEVDSNSII